MYIKKRTILIFTSIIVLIFSAAGVYAATTESINTTTIYACQTKQIGLLRVVDVNTACTKNETKISWNVVGPKGDKGDKGDTGVPGPKGDTGAVGAVGATGPQGPKGDTGATGATGTAGPQGLTGIDGAVGPQGTQGPKGDTGAQGVAGPAGPQGVKGDTGAMGPAGPAGGTKIIVGKGYQTGFTFQGTGYTITPLASGGVSIFFPAGTFSHEPIITVTPWVAAGSIGTSAQIVQLGAYASGAFEVHVRTSNSSGYTTDPFMFTAVESQ